MDSQEKDSRIFTCYKYILFELKGEEKKTNQKIQRTLKKLGYAKADVSLLDDLRNLQIDLENEIKLFHKSKYHLGYHREHTSIEDFDTNKMMRDFGEKFPSIPKSDMGAIVGITIFGNYIR